VGDLDDILKAHKVKKEDEKRQRGEAVSTANSAKDNILAEFKKSFDGTILPILREYEESLSQEGYQATIQQQDDKVIFEFNIAEGAISSATVRHIIFQPAAQPNVTMSFDGRDKLVECNTFFIREELLGIFKKVFPSD
jgi:hypothetical protein